MAEEKVLFVRQDNVPEETYLKILTGQGVHVRFCDADAISVMDTLHTYQPGVVVLNLYTRDFNVQELMHKVQRWNGRSTRFVAMCEPALEMRTRRLLHDEVEGVFATTVEPELLCGFILELSRYHTTSLEKCNEQALFAMSIADFTHRAGVPVHIKGYHYVKTAILLSLSNPMYLCNVTQNLYSVIAEQYHTDSACVERAIRHAIRLAWKKGKIAELNRYYGYQVFDETHCPSNTAFIAAAVECLEMLHERRLILCH